MHKSDRLLGYGYEVGGDVALDYAQALNWYQKAAGHGFADAYYHLGVLFANGWGVAEDQVQAIDWYRKAASIGHV